MKELNDPNFPYIVQLGLGTNPNAKTTWILSDLEAVNGAITWGIGRQQYFFEKQNHLYPYEKKLTAKNHFDPSMLNGTLWLDDELLLQNGRYISDELK